MLRSLYAFLLGCLIAYAAQADVIIKLKNGRTIEVPVDCTEVESISFSGHHSPGERPQSHNHGDVTPPPQTWGTPATQPGQTGRGNIRGLAIQSAIYGAGGRTCNATEQVATQCQGKEFCQIYVANNYMCGDPWPGREKEVVVDFECNGQKSRLSFPEGAQLLLRCPQ